MIAILRRRTELGLIVLGAVIVGGAYTLASLGRTSSIPANIGPFLGIILVLFIAAHVATRKLASGADGLLLPIAALLNGIGYVMIARLDEASRKPQGLAAAQAGWTVIGIGAYIGTLLLIRRSRDLQRYRYTFLLIGLLLLMAPLAPGIGREINGARIWAYIGRSTSNLVSSRRSSWPSSSRPTSWRSASCWGWRRSPASARSCPT